MDTPIRIPDQEEQPTALDDPERGRRAWASVREELEALPRASLAVVNLDVPAAVGRALAHAPAICALRAPIASALPLQPLADLDLLETYAFAAWFAHVRCLGERPARGRALFDEAIARRRELREACAALARKGLLDRGRLSACRGRLRTADVATELVALCSLLAERWDAIARRTALERADVAAACSVGHRLLLALEARPDDAAFEARARAFTRFVQAYDACRRAVAVVRRADGDADRIAPSLYVRRTSRRREG